MDNKVRIAMASGVVDIRENKKNKHGLNLMGSLNTLSQAVAMAKNSNKDLDMSM